MKSDSRVLDLCSGDGSIPYLFYTDICEKIDCVDKDSDANRYAKRRFKHPKLNFHQIDILKAALPTGNYTHIIWNAGLYYFKFEDARFVLKKLIEENGRPFLLIGHVPKGNGHVDHQFEFASEDELKDFLSDFFNHVSVTVVTETDGQKFYFQASGSSIVEYSSL